MQTLLSVYGWVYFEYLTRGLTGHRAPRRCGEEKCDHFSCHVHRRAKIEV